MPELNPYAPPKAPATRPPRRPPSARVFAIGATVWLGIACFNFAIGETWPGVAAMGTAIVFNFIFLVTRRDARRHQ